MLIFLTFRRSLRSPHYDILLAFMAYIILFLYISIYPFIDIPISIPLRRAPLLLAYVVGGLGFEFWFCVFVTGWRHALRSEWPFISIIIITPCSPLTGL